MNVFVIHVFLKNVAGFYSLHCLIHFGACDCNLGKSGTIAMRILIYPWNYQMAQFLALLVQLDKYHSGHNLPIQLCEM